MHRGIFWLFIEQESSTTKLSSGGFGGLFFVLDDNYFIGTNCVVFKRKSYSELSTSS